MFYAGWTEAGAHTFDPEKAQNVKAINCLAYEYTGETNFPEINVLTGLEQFTNLENLTYISPAAPLTDLSPLASLTGLKYLNINLANSGYVSDVSDLSSLTNLEQLVLSGYVGSGLDSIANLTKLKKIALENIHDSPSASTKLSDISFLANLTSLETILLRNNNISDTNITALSNLTNLKYLALDGNEHVSSDTPTIRNLENLVYLDIRDTREAATSTTGEQSIHPKFNDGVLYKGVVDSYYYQQGNYPLGSVPFFDFEYDKAAHRQEILTDEQLASIENLVVFDGSPIAGRMVSITDVTGIETMPNLKTITLDVSNFADEKADFSAVPKLEKFHIFSSGVDTFDFSQNPNLKDVYLWQSNVSHLDFSNNPMLQKLTIWSNNLTFLDLSNCSNLNQLNLTMSPNVEEVNLPDSRLRSFLLTGTTEEPGNTITTRAIKITPALSTRLTIAGGRGGEGSDTDNVEEYYELDVDNLKFLNYSNTNIEGEIENESFLPSTDDCSFYDKTTNTINVKSSCVANGLKTVTYTHEYTIGDTEYSNTFEIVLNVVDINTYYYVDGVLYEQSNNPTAQTVIGATFDSEKYQEKPNEESFKNASLKEVKVIAQTIDGETTVELGDQSTDSRKYGAITDDQTLAISFVYYYESETPAIPDTGRSTDNNATSSSSPVLAIISSIMVGMATTVFAIILATKRNRC